jgi:DNA-binding transcriptional MerR regulator
MIPRRYRVKDVSGLSGVSIRTLHHYDQIGLLSPSGRSEVGYRLYSDDDLLRLQQILVQRELGLPLEEIRRQLDDPAFDRVASLRRQRVQLLQRAEHTHAMIRALDAVLAQTGEQDMSIDMKQIFEGFDPAQYEREAEARWGDTDAYKESRRRARSYTKEDWERMKAENRMILQHAADALRDGTASDDPAVLDIAERHRQSIERWFYPCSKAFHRSLSDLYESDERYAQSFEQIAPGLSAFLIAAIRANAVRP